MGNGRALEVKFRRYDGRIASRQYLDVTPEQARKKAMKSGIVKAIMSVRKIQLWEHMGSIQVDKMRDVITTDASRYSRDYETDILLSPTSIEDVLFPKRKRVRGEGRGR